MATLIDEVTKAEIATNISTGAFYAQQYYPDLLIYTYDPDYQVILGNSHDPTYHAGLYVKSNMVGVRTSPSGNYAFEVGGNMRCEQDATFSQTVLVKSNMDVENDFIARGTATFSQTVLLSSNLDVTDDMVVRGTLRCDGDAMFQKTVLLNSNLDVTDDVIVRGSLSCDSNATFSQTVNIESNLDVSNDLIVRGSLRLPSGLAIGASQTSSNNTVFMSPTGATVFSLDNQNNATFTCNVYAKAFYALSDERAKTNITDLASDHVRACVDMVRSMSVKTFNYRGESTPRIGVVAQDLRRLESESALPFRMVDNDPTTPMGMMTIDVSQILAAVVCTLQDVMARLPKL